MVQTTINHFGLAPYFLFKAALEEEPIEKIKYVISTIISGIH